MGENSQQNETEEKKQEVYSNKQEVYSYKQEVYSNKQEVYSNKQQVYSYKQEVHSNKQEVHSNKQKVYSRIQEKLCLGTGERNAPVRVFRIFIQCKNYVHRRFKQKHIKFQLVLELIIKTGNWNKTFRTFLTVFSIHCVLKN